MRVFFALAALLAAFLAPASAAAERARVLAVELENDINPVTADYLVDHLERADEEGFDAVVVLLDKPGGLADSMREITKAELASRVPVVVYVAPDCAEAASAGVWIGQAADVLAMAPQTNLGSSTPVGIGGEEIPADMRRKVVNNAAKSLRALAEEHGRNGEWAEQAVRKADNLTAREALRRDVIDLVAPSLPALLDEIDGRKTKPKGLVLATAGAEVERVEMSLWKRVLDTIIDPNIILLLMSLGLLGITVEIMSPGLIFPGTLGAIALVLGLFGLQVLPVNWAGVLLLLLAAAFLGAEAFVMSHGALALAGAASFVFGALLLFDPAGAAYQVSLPVALAVGGTLALFVGVAVGKVVQARRARPQTGQEELVGQLGVVRRPLDPTGLVFVHGELWRARTEDGQRLGEGEAVGVGRVAEGLILEVRRDEEPTPVA